MNDPNAADADSAVSGDPSDANARPPEAIDPKRAEELRAKFYNATLIDRRDVHDDLACFRVRPDAGVPQFKAGQYVAIGLGYWEPRLRGTQHEDVPEKRRQKVVRRAYSISCPLIDSQGKLTTHADIDYFEFYITLVREAATVVSKPPALTPRLFGLAAGDRLVVEKKVVGTYCLEGISPEDTVVMLGTGTGEAPHNAMLADLLSSGHTGRIVLATSARFRSDLGYLAQHQKLTSAYPHYRYLPLTTREVQNLDPTHPEFVGKQYLQALFTSGKLAEMADDPLDPSNTHVFLCGNPDMIGYVPPGGDPPERPGMLPLLREAGFRDDFDQPGPGCVRFEKYW
ncbi:MAG: ferredoxin--NADP reductase [Planctomycetota bacterium]